MTDFIFEEELKNVPNSVVREYLAEVIACYNMGFYRSAIVSLHNVVLCDFIYKLRTLSEVYEDQKANDILSELGDSQSNIDEKYSEWEKKLIGGVRQTKLIDEQEIDLIKRLREDRHHCAHPALKDTNLYIPNKDQTRAHIRNMFETVFLKETILAKEIIKPILEDIKRYFKEIGNNNIERFTQHLVTRYYNKLNRKSEKELFKTLWKFVFQKYGEDYNENRLGCYYALVALIKRDEHKFLGYLKEGVLEYCNIKINEEDAFINTGIYIEYKRLQQVDLTLVTSPQALLIYFLSEFGLFYGEMKEHVDTVIQHEADKNINLYVRLLYSKDSFTEHLNAIFQYRVNVSSTIDDSNFYHYYKQDTSITVEQVNYLLHEAEKRNSIQSLVGFSLRWLKESSSYDSTPYVFETEIFPIFDKFNREDILELLEIMYNNGQISGETKYKHRYMPVVRARVAELLGDDFEHPVLR
ncbi:hypothetical protein [Paenibacillus tundrae]|uniref:Uncharacterized protein n=1 Tax=Paenibacillus tundrae TaxID=528187 RepID=A0ABT9WER1_9BACL|nr:hypothetical protein [Paenibacillus tundrae]MDQ0171757.1 hypothetical protein [Paenibacillus tundrae]